VTDYVKTRIASIAKGRTGADLRPEVLGGLDSTDAVVALSAAIDFGRIEGIATGVTDAEVDRVVAAFEKNRRPDRRKRALTVALGVTKSKRAVAPLVAAVVAGKARTYRAEVGRALARIGDEAAVKALTDGLKSERAATRADTVNVLGRSGLDDAAKVIVKALADPAGEVRIEAAMAVGEIARTLRSRKEDAPAAHEALAAVYANAPDTREKKAALWAAAQLDTQAGYDVVRKAAANDADRTIREFASRTLKNPRRRLVL
jgi:HEAT repeat protein